MLTRLGRVGTEESDTAVRSLFLIVLRPCLYTFQLAQTRSEIEAVLMRHLKRDGSIYLLSGMSIGIIVTKVSRRGDVKGGN